MLTSLHIENIAVVEKTDISFAGGFNVLTGETGAGKSIVIDAISAIIGQRTSHDLIRTGADFAIVSAVFEQLDDDTVNLIGELGFSCEDNSLIIYRKIMSDGRNSVKINGMPATVAVLKRIGALLINIHGQHDSLALFDVQKQLEFIDLVAENTELFEKYKSLYAQTKKTKSELDAVISETDDKNQRADYLRYVINELEAAQIEPGERDSLVQQRDMMRNSVTIAEQLNASYNLLNGDDYNEGVSSVIRQAASGIETASKYMPDIAALSEKLSEFSYEIDEIASTVNQALSNIDFDPSLLESIELRLDYLYRLSKKYGSTEEDMIEFLEKSKSELSLIDNSEENIEKLRAQYEKLSKELKSAAEKLTASRIKAAEGFESDVCSQLEFLDMPKVRFEVHIDPKEYSADGCDDVSYYISTNPGEPPKPLSKIASGGELSRIMLAIKSVLADKDSIGTLIFDEIDTGISGSAARKVGIKIMHTAQNRQVICVTHLAQIASLADCHFKIEKRSENGKTYTDVTQLDFDGRVNELARIMSAGVPTDATRASAKELIDFRSKK